MTDLAAKTCKPCEGGVRPLTKDEVTQRLNDLADGWQADADSTEIVKTFLFKNYYQTMSFVNAVAHIANCENHHPDLQVSYDHCRVRYSTHAIDGLSENDFICAAKVDKLTV